MIKSCYQIMDVNENSEAPKLTKNDQFKANVFKTSTPNLNKIIFILTDTIDLMRPGMYTIIHKITDMTGQPYVDSQSIMRVLPSHNVGDYKLLKKFKNKLKENGNKWETETCQGNLDQRVNITQWEKAIKDEWVEYFTKM